MEHHIKTDRREGSTVEVFLVAASDGNGLVIDCATDAKISRIHDHFPSAMSALERMTKVAQLRSGVKAMIINTPDDLPGSEPH